MNVHPRFLLIHFSIILFCLNLFIIKAENEDGENFLSIDDVSQLFNSAHNFSSPLNHHLSNFLKIFFDKLQNERINKIDSKYIKETYFKNLTEKTEKLFNATLHYLKTPAPDSRVEIANACVDVPPIGVLKSLREALADDDNAFLKASFSYYYSTDSIKALENYIKIFSEQLLIFEGLCLSFEEVDRKDEAKSDEEIIASLDQIIDEIGHSIYKQENQVKEIYFPEAAKEVIKQFLSHYGSESFSFFSNEIKSFNEKVAKDLVEYLNHYYRGVNKFAAGVNRKGYHLIGKLPSDSVIQVTWNGWSVFVYRSPASASSYLQMTTNNIYEIINAAQKSPKENEFCSNLSNLNLTMENIFNSIKNVCNEIKFCGIWPYSNVGENTSNGNLGIEKYSVCDSTKFSGFSIYFGLNENIEEESSKNVTTKNTKIIPENYEIFRKKLIENVHETIVVEEAATTTKNETEIKVDGKNPYKIYNLHYTPSLQQKIPLPIIYGEKVFLLNEMGLEEAPISEGGSTNVVGKKSIISLIFVVSFLFSFFVFEF